LAATPNFRSGLPQPVVDAVNKIYSRVEDSDPLGPLPIEPVKVRPPTYKVRYNLSVTDLRYTEILSKLEKIESAGFNNSPLWFSLNHELEGIRVRDMIVPCVYDTQSEIS